MPGAMIVHIVDDDESFRTAIGGLLRSMDYQVALYGSAPEFLSSSRGIGPACLLLDMRLPGLTGGEFQRRLVEMGIEIPVIMMSGDGAADTVAKAMEGGAAAFLSKPLSEDALIGAIETVLRGQCSPTR